MARPVQLPQSISRSKTVFSQGRFRPSTAMLYERAGRFVDYLKERYDGKQVLAVGHGLINRAVQAHIQGVTLEHLRSVPKMNNAELRRFKLT